MRFAPRWHTLHFLALSIVGLDHSSIQQIYCFIYRQWLSFKLRPTIYLRLNWRPTWTLQIWTNWIIQFFQIQPEGFMRSLGWNCNSSYMVSFVAQFLLVENSTSKPTEKCWLFLLIWSHWSSTKICWLFILIRSIPRRKKINYFCCLKNFGQQKRNFPCCRKF